MNLSFSRLTTFRPSEFTDLRSVAAALLSFFVIRQIPQPSKPSLLSYRPLASPSGLQSVALSSRHEKHAALSARLEGLRIALQFNFEDVARYIIASFGAGEWSTRFHLSSPPAIFYFMFHLPSYRLMSSISTAKFWSRDSSSSSLPICCEHLCHNIHHSNLYVFDYLLSHFESDLFFYLSRLLQFILNGFLLQFCWFSRFSRIAQMMAVSL